MAPIVPTASWSGQQQPYTGGLKLNPVAGDVLATTGSLAFPTSSYTARILIASTVIGSTRIQQLDTDGLTLLYDQYVYFLASTPFQLDFTLALSSGQSVQVVSGATLLGSVQVSIFI